MTKKLFLTAIIIFAASTFAIAGIVGENGRLQVIGNQLSNECGNPIQLRGLSSHGLQWKANCYTAASLDYAVSIGMDVIRAACYVEEGGYKLYPAYMTNEVNDLVDFAVERDIYVIIDWHVLQDCDPNINLALAQTFWTDMATTHKDKKNVIYEICNEPNPGYSGNPFNVDGKCMGWGTLTQAAYWQQIVDYANIIIPLIRGIDPDAVILVGTPNWSQLGNEVINNPLPYSNIMYSMHFYADEHSTWMLTNAVDSIPIFATEWGTTAASGDGPPNITKTAQFMDIMNGNNTYGTTISWAMWSFSDDWRQSSMFQTSTCPNGPWNDTRLTSTGLIVKDLMMTPTDNFMICFSPTFTPTVTPTGTITLTLTVTSTHSITQTHTDTYTPTMTPTVSQTSTGTSTVTVTPTNTPTPTITMTLSNTPPYTHTVTGTITVTPTITVTATVTMTNTLSIDPYVSGTDIKIGNHYPYPNPNKTGRTITIKYEILNKTAKDVTINIYTLGDRKIASFSEESLQPGEHESVWRFDQPLANGMYYYTIEASNVRGSQRKIGALLVIKGRTPKVLIP